MRLINTGMALGAALTLSACASTESALDSIGLGGVEEQGCALGGLGGGILGNIIGNRVGGQGGGLIGTIVGGGIGTLLGCSAGKVIEERRAKAGDEATFLEQQVTLLDEQTDNLESQNADMEDRLDTNDQVIKQLKSQKTPLAQRKQQATAAYDINAATIKQAQTDSKKVSAEIEIQETLLAELEEDGTQGKRVNDIKQQVSRLKDANAELEDAIQRLSAQNDEIGRFR